VNLSFRTLYQIIFLTYLFTHTHTFNFTDIALQITAKGGRKGAVIRESGGKGENGDG